MSARILPFPKHSRSLVRVERDRDDGEWLVIHGGNAWPCSSREAALREAADLADQWSATLVAETG
jgi:hypothetical protein